MMKRIKACFVTQKMKNEGVLNIHSTPIRASRKWGAAPRATDKNSSRGFNFHGSK